MKLDIKKICKSIENKHNELGHKLGWRFINSSINTYIDNSGICILTLNPGGSKFEKSICALQNGKNAYLDESWNNQAPGKDKLQVQIKFLFKEINKRLKKYESSEELMRNSLFAHFIPFRSQRFSKLHKKNDSIEFSENLWSNIVNSEDFDLSIIICIGKKQFETINKILKRNPFYNQTSTKKLSTGWGNDEKSKIEYFSTINRFRKEDRTLSLVYLPHLSTFQIFNRIKGEREIKELMDYISGGLFI